MLNLLLSIFLWAYIPPTKMILQRTVENSGNGIYAIDQEVEFSNGNDSLSWREIWLVENERSMRLTLLPPKELAGAVKLQYVYAGGQRWFLNSSRKRESQKVSDEFIERWLHFRHLDSFQQALVQNKILPPSALAAPMSKKAPRSGDDFKYEPEPYVRLGRAQNVVTYAFGVPTPENDDRLQPGLWIEQDFFLIRKIRWPNQVELTADDHAPYAKGLHFPKLRTLKWGSNTVTFKILNIIPRTGNLSHFFQPQSLDFITTFEGIQNSPLKSTIEEFYTRFR